MTNTPATVERAPETEEPHNRPARRANADFKVVLGMAAVVVTAAVIALSTIRQSSVMVYRPEAPDPNPSPWGYTVSLALFIIPVAVLKIWFLRHPQYPVEKKPYWLTMLILTPLGFGLDLFFGDSFFEFPNQAATLGVRLPGYTFGVGWLIDRIPLEEFLFYFAGFLAILLIYVWGNIYWFGSYDFDDYHQGALQVKRIINFHWPLAALAVALIVGGILFKKFAAPPGYQAGFPGYFTFMVIAGIVPTIALYKTVKPFINWRAFSFSLFALLFLSLLWEGALGTPYGWWDYQPETMLGLVIRPLNNLPIEAVCLWFIATWLSLTVYEVVKIAVHMQRGFWEALFGKKS